MDEQILTDPELHMLRIALDVYTFIPIPAHRETCDKLAQKGLLFKCDDLEYTITSKGMITLEKVSDRG